MRIWEKKTFNQNKVINSRNRHKNLSKRLDYGFYCNFFCGSSSLHIVTFMAKPNESLHEKNQKCFEYLCSCVLAEAILPCLFCWQCGCFKDLYISFWMGIATLTVEKKITFFLNTQKRSKEPFFHHWPNDRNTLNRTIKIKVCMACEKNHFTIEILTTFYVFFLLILSFSYLSVLFSQSSNLSCCFLKYIHRDKKYR